MNTTKVFPFRANLGKGTMGPRLQQRVGWLTPYEVETLFADALWAGRGSQLEVSLPAKTSDAGVAWIRGRFDPLRKRGIGVRVQRDEGWVFQDAAVPRLRSA
jgi:hypothetical protein